METDPLLLQPLLYDAFACDNDAITRALQLCVAADAYSTAAPSLADFITAAPVRADHNHGGCGAAAPAPTGKVGKRKRRRPSRRAPITYISTDAANFQLMVQRITGPADPECPPDILATPAAGMLHPDTATAGNCSATPFGSTAPATAAAELGYYQRLGVDQVPCFPTLDSWNVTCENDGIF